MMVTLLRYAYCTGVYSSRKIGRQVIDSVAFRFLAAGNTPDFRTISEFRHRHGPALAALFEQVLHLCRRAGLVKLGRVAIDGTKIKDERLQAQGHELRAHEAGGGAAAPGSG
jgi:transposase